MSTQKEDAIWRRLGDIIRRERVANGLTYASVAKRSGVAVRTLMHFEQGENENGLRGAGRAAAACGDESRGREAMAGGSPAGRTGTRHRGQL